MCLQSVQNQCILMCRKCVQTPPIVAISTVYSLCRTSVYLCAENVSKHPLLLPLVQSIVCAELVYTYVQKICPNTLCCCHQYSLQSVQNQCILMCRKYVQTPPIVAIVHLHRYKSNCGLHMQPQLCCYQYKVYYPKGYHATQIPGQIMVVVTIATTCKQLCMRGYCIPMLASLTVMSEHTMFDVPSSSWWSGTTTVLLYSLWWGCILVW